jgi:signal transduction histidine kinase/CheY-like chemotaxis protein
MSASTSSLPGHRPSGRAGDDTLQKQVWSERMRALCGHVPTVMLAGGLFSFTLFGLLYQALAPRLLWTWLALRLLIGALRWVHARRYSRLPEAQRALWYRLLLVIVAADGLLWGAVWWALVPIERPDLTIVTLTAIVGVGALSAFIMHADVRVMALHLLPMMLPNVIFCLSKPDAFGIYGAVALAIFSVLLLLETRRAQGRLVELLTLRFSHERVLDERAQALELAQHHSEAKSRFLASMSHEMRTPLHGILGLSRLLREDEASASKLRRFELIERSGEHLLTVINDVLDVSKIEAGGVHIDSQPFDLGQLIADVVGVSAVNAQAKGLALQLHSSLPACQPVRGDAMRVRQILHNLLGNAIEFTEQGSVSLHVQREPGSEQITLTVQDTGIGIDAAEQAHIFDAFHQVDHARDRRHGGTGLGLTISRQLSLAMGGELRCSSSKGQGSIFECMLCLPECAADVLPGGVALSRLSAVPAQPGEPLPHAAQLAWPAAQRQACVLLVEDNPINALVAEAALRQFGLQVETVGDGRQALEWLALQRADLVLMDCQMPVLDGVEAARQIRLQEQRLGQRRVPMIALTANVFPLERERCLAAGMDDYLGKPFKREELYDMLAQHMALHQALPRSDARAA